MKHLLLLVGLLTLLSSCQNTSSEKKNTSETTVIPTAKAIDYPDALDKIFDHHGTLDTWKKMKSLSYEIVKEEGNEKQTIDLVTRKEVIESPTFKSGYDGNEYWVEADTTYKGNPKFYTNLNFYFYAMPFVLADEGIKYTPAAPLTFEGTDYPGFRISYDDGVGISSKDEYFIHYDAKTNEMAWLGYTVTFHSGEVSERISWIRYNDWNTIEGLKLPNVLTWYHNEEGQITTPRKDRKFVNVNISQTESNPSIFAKTEGSRVVE